MAKMSATRNTDWVVLWATSPVSNYMALPRDVARLLGCTREDLAQLRRPQRAIAFLARPVNTLRVIGVHRHANLMGLALRQNQVVGIAQVTPTNVTFNVPDAAEMHMGIQTYRRPAKPYTVTGTDDSLAWIMPADEYYPYRRAVREGKPFVPPREGVHIYFRKALFNDLLPGPQVIEPS